MNQQTKLLRNKILSPSLTQHKISGNGINNKYLRNVNLEELPTNERFEEMKEYAEFWKQGILIIVYKSIKENSNERPNKLEFRFRRGKNQEHFGNKVKITVNSLQTNKILHIYNNSV